MESEPQQKAGKPRTWMLVKAAVGISLIFILVWNVGPHELLRQLRQISPKHYFFVLLLYAGGEAARTVRWQRLLQVVGAEFKLFSLIRLQFIGAFFNHVLPTSIGGDGVRVYYLCKRGVAWEKALGSVLVERVIGMLMLLLLGLVAGMVGFSIHKNPQILGALSLFTVGFATGAYLLFSPRAFQSLLRIVEKLKRKKLLAGIERFSAGIHVYRAYPRVLLFVAVVSLAFQALVICLFYYFSIQLQMNVPIGYFFIIVPLFISVSLLPFTPGGLGVREWAFTFLLVNIGADASKATLLALLWLLVTLGAGLMGGLAFITYPREDSPAAPIRGSRF